VQESKFWTKDKRWYWIFETLRKWKRQEIQWIDIVGLDFTNFIM